MRKRTVVFLVVGCGLSAVVAGFWRLRASRAVAEPAAIETVRVARRTIATVVKATGVIKPRVGAEVRVGSRVSGVVNRLYVKVGDAVTKGQLLAELDDRDFVARRDQAEADFRRSLTEARYAWIDAQRQRQLGAQKIVAVSELDSAERASAVTGQQAGSAQAALAFAAAQLDYTRITAPIGGVVASVSTQEGETVAASFAAPTFVTLVDLSRLEVWAYVDETDIGRVQTGQSARFTVDTYADHEFEGEVTTIYPTAEIRDNVVDYVTVVRFEAPRDFILRPEMTTTVRIARQRRENVPCLPLRAIRWDGGRAYVRVPGSNGSEERAVTTGARDDSFCEIVDGVREGDAVLVGEANPKDSP